MASLPDDASDALAQGYRRSFSGSQVTCWLATSTVA